MTAFNWLHLTDLHWGLAGQKHLWPEIREHFFGDLAKLHAKCGPWQAVLFSGDFVQQGDRDEFKQLEQHVLSPLWDKFRTLGCDPVLLAVPGNHDLVRPDIKKAGSRKSALRWLLRPEEFTEIADEVFDNKKSHERHLIERAFSNFTDWWKQRPDSLDQDIHQSEFPGDFSTTFETADGHRIGILGLNTTFLQLAGGDYKGRLAWDLRQFHAACQPDGPAWANAHDVCLLMTHQGPEWLDGPSQQKVYSQINPAGRFAVHLFGHMHDEEIQARSYRGGPLQRLWQSTSLFGLEHYGEIEKEDRRHGYSAGSLEFREDHALLRRWPREALWDKVNGWHFEPDREDCILEDDDGTRAETIELRRATSSNTAEGSPVPVDDLQQITERLLGAYHRSVQQTWDDRWSGVITDDEQDQPGE